MKLQMMKFKNFQWPQNPAELHAARERNIRELRIPFMGGILQDYGRKKRVITGAGEFNGSRCLSEYQQLEALFAAGGSGLLSLPGAEPFMATLVSLEKIEKPMPNCVTYRFVFWEDQSAAVTAQTSQHSFHICEKDENLWQIAAAYATTVEKLTALNPQIPWPNQLEEGERVILP